MQSRSQLLLCVGHCQIHGARNVFCGFLAASTKWFRSVQRPFSALRCSEGKTLWNRRRLSGTEVLPPLCCSVAL